MNKIVHKFLLARDRSQFFLAGDKFMLNLNLRQDLFIVVVDRLLNIMKEFKNS